LDTDHLERSRVDDGIHATEPHLGIMGSIDQWCDEAAFVEWEHATPDFPKWPAAFDRLVQQGRSQL
jgi:hypothetical protein